MDAKIAHEGHDFVDDMELDEMYRQALDRVLREDSRVNAAGNIRMGEFILLVDADTRVVSLSFCLYSIQTLINYSSRQTVCFTGQWRCFYLLK